MAKDLNKFGINTYVNIEYSDRISWLLIFESHNLANQTLATLSSSKTCYNAIILLCAIYKKTVIKGIPKDISMEELSTEIRASNPDIFIKDIERMKRRHREKNFELVDSESVRITMRAVMYPDFLYIWRMKIEVHSFILNIR